MKKKKLLFVIPEYSHGGTNKNLESLLHFLDKEKYDLSIISLYEDGGDYYKNIFAPYIYKKSILYHLLHDNLVTRKFLGLYHKINKKANFDWLYKNEAKRLNKMKYDIAIAFQEGTATEFVSYMTECKKIAWVQCDYGVFLVRSKYPKSHIYIGFDKIVCVSKAAATSMCKHTTGIQNKIVSIYNPIVTQTIKESATLNVTDLIHEEDFNIISVGRIDPIKQFDYIPSILNTAKDLLKKNVNWYIIGAGSGEHKEKIKNEIAKYELQGSIILVEAKDNPYPYIKNANLYVCTSLSESFSYSIFESKILHTPVVSNNFPVAQEVVEKDCGWICSLEEMPDLLVKIINDEGGIYTKMKESISSYEYSNDDIIKEIEKILDN